MAPKTSNQTSPTTKPQARPVGRPRKISTSDTSPQQAPAPKRRHQPKAKPQDLPVLAPSYQSKQARLIELLKSSKGATVDQMTALTGWQAHTVRGTISGVLRKRLGLTVVCEAPDASAVRVYRITACA